MEESLKVQFSRLIDQIVTEENSFQLRLATMRIDQSALEEVHDRLVGKYGDRPDHVRVRALHEAMFKVHRKIRSEHDRAIQRSISMGSKVANGLLPESQVMQELKALELLLKRMKADHNLLERERRRILAEHEASLREMGQ